MRVFTAARTQGRITLQTPTHGVPSAVWQHPLPPALARRHTGRPTVYLMATFTLLRCIGKAAAKYGLNALAGGLPLGDLLVGCAGEAMDEWTRKNQEAEREAELQALLEANREELQREVREIVRAELTEQPEELQEEMAAFLMQVPTKLRQKASPQSASSGTGIKRTVLLSRPEDLLTLFGDVPASFQRGSRSKQRTLAELQDLLRLDHSLNGGIIYGIEGYVIEIQARAMQVLSKPKPWRAATTISGMARGAIAESLDRIAGACAKLGLPHPQVEILINLVPADLPKEGTWLDLPLAVILLQASGFLPPLPDHRQGDFILFGELGIHGEVRRVPGALPLAFRARPGQRLIVPVGNEKECALILAKPGHETCRVCGVSTLEELVDFFLGKRKLESALRHGIQYENLIPKAVDFGTIRGQELAKEGACIAAAGGHNLLLIGPPGEGKSLLASALPGILPRLTSDEKVQLTKIYSACGELERDGVAVTRRPVRSIHHTASKQALVGGGSKLPKPGEITKAHLGILFLDEIAEFSASTLDALRQPLESGEVSISRVGGTLSYPCRFTLVAAMNPCPCGYYGTEKCTCSDADVKRYQKKISGPILDRIDLQVELRRLSTEERFAETSAEVSPRLRAQVEAARERQNRRFAGTGIPFNAAIPGGQVRDLCNFSPEGFEFYKQSVAASNLSTRSMDRLAKVARTVADLANAEQIEPQHVGKATEFVIGGLLRSG